MERALKLSWLLLKTERPPFPIGAIISCPSIIGLSHFQWTFPFSFLVVFICINRYWISPCMLLFLGLGWSCPCEDVPLLFFVSIAWSSRSIIPTETSLLRITEMVLRRSREISIIPLRVYVDSSASSLAFALIFLLLCRLIPSSSETWDSPRRVMKRRRTNFPNLLLWWRLYRFVLFCFVLFWLRYTWIVA